MNGHHQVVHVSFVSTLSPGPKKIVPPSRIPMWSQEGKLEGEIVGGNIDYLYLAASKYPHEKPFILRDTCME